MGNCLGPKYIPYTYMDPSGDFRGLFRWTSSSKLPHGDILRIRAEIFTFPKGPST